MYTRSLFYCLSGLFILTNSFIDAQPVNTTPIRFNGVATVRLLYQLEAVPVKIYTRIYRSFPSFDFYEHADSLPTGINEVFIQCPIYHPQDGYLQVGKTELRLMLTLGDTVEIKVGRPATFDADSIYSFEFAGKSAAIQEYYVEKHRHFPVSPSQAAMTAGTKAASLTLFQQQIDSLSAAEQGFWQNYRQKHPLPDWFVRYESDDIRYSNAYLRLYMIWYQADVLHHNQMAPAAYFNFLKTIPVPNPAAQFDYSYGSFLREFINWKAGKATKKVDASLRQSAEFAVADQVLGKEQGDYFKIWTVGYSLLDKPTDVLAYFKNHAPLPKHMYLADFLIKQANSRIRTLQPGDLAPNFFLPDLRDSLVSLQQFKGQVVYLCFWFVGCKGCVQELPFEHKLVDEFAGKPVQIISICTFTRPDVWRQESSRLGVKTLNLFANKAWQKTLEEKYAIGVYPHYVLIDAEGRIVHNFAARPSDNAATLIRSALARTTR